MSAKEDNETFRMFKEQVLIDGFAGLWLREPFLDSLNWFPDASEAERLELAERALRELFHDGFVKFRHHDTGKPVEPSAFGNMFASPTWTHDDDSEFGDVEYFQTPSGARSVGLEEP